MGWRRKIGSVFAAIERRPVTPTPRRRREDDRTTVRLTGHTGRQLATQVVGGVLLAAVVGAVSAWGTQQVLGERLGSLTREVQQLRGDVQEMRRDLYQPRVDRRAFNVLPSGRP